MDDKERIKMSKKMTYLLRHKEGFVDKEGWVEIERLVEALRKWFPYVTKEHVLYVVSKDEKGRYEVKGNRIRARYGHTINVNVNLNESFEETLYHGTSCDVLSSIKEKGILPMRRKWVHLTKSMDEAIENAKRKGKCIVILVVDGNCLRSRGHSTYEAGKNVRVTDYVPPECIRTVIVPRKDGGTR